MYQTIPSQDFFSSSENNPENSKALCIYHEALQELFAFATNLLDWEVEAVADDDKYLIPLMFFRRIVEILDAISLQVKHSVIVPCDAQLRVMFETILGLEFLLKEDSIHRAEIFAIVSTVYNVKKALEIRERLQYLKSLRYKNSHQLEEIEFLEKLDLNNYIEERRVWLKENDEDDYIYNLFNKRTIKKDYVLKDVKWYSFVNNGKGPGSVWQLVENLKREELYHTLYHEWSNFTHASNIFDKNIHLEDSESLFIAGFRSPEKAQEVTIAAVEMTLFSIELMIKRTSFRPNYQRNVYGDYMWWINQFTNSYYKQVKKNQIHFRHLK